jgi:putative redox protein
MLPRRSKHSVVATALGGQAFEASVRGHAIRADPAGGSGDARGAPTPVEMLSVALAGCVALYVQRYCTRHGFDGRGLTVEVNPVWKSEPGRIGRFDVALHLPDTIPPQHHDAIDRFARTCPVHQTLTLDPAIAVKIVCLSPGAPRGSPLDQVVRRSDNGIGVDAEVAVEVRQIA